MTASRSGALAPSPDQATRFMMLARRLALALAPRAQPPERRDDLGDADAVTGPLGGAQSVLQVRPSGAISRSAASGPQVPAS